MNAPLPPQAWARAEALSAHGWDALVQSLPGATWIVEAHQLRVVAANRAAHELLGRAEDSLVGERAEALMLTPEDLAYWEEAAAGRAGALVSDATVCASNGRLVHVARSVQPFADGASGKTYYTVVLTDLTERQQAEERLEEALSELRATMESTADGILVTDLAGRIRVFNQRLAQIWSIPTDLLEQRRDDAVHDWIRRSVTDDLKYQRRLQAITGATLLSAVDRLELHTGQVVERVTQPLWQRGRPMGRVYSFRDLSDRVKADQRIAQLSHTDALTGLPNRAELTAAVESAVNEQHRQGGHFALMLVDLDRFRTVNDSFGTTTGDRVLLETTRRIRSCMRQGDLVARVAGDQFVLLIHRADPDAAEVAARRVLDAVALPSRVDGVQFTLTCSIGVAMCPVHGRTLDELLQGADEAMRRVKTAGRGNWRVHDMRRDDDQRKDMRLDHAMRQALVGQRFRLHYQPQVDMASGAIVGAEALIRWREAEFGGDVPPGVFIPVAERSGFIVAIGDWVMTEAVRQAAQWVGRGWRVPVAVNVSALQFQQPNFVDRLAAVLAEHGLDPQWLELELTESILVHDADDTLHRLNALARLGVRLSIDDFGTGYSSLAYLKRFPIGKLKIDRSFVRGLPDDDSDAGIVRAILQMARALGMRVIAEGVETECQRRFLADAGCSEYQGFLYAPALDSRRFEERLAHRSEETPTDGCAVRLVGG
jgi:diguanylate cyclase (GGDEF)-like protein/PAS domain S-box-containing protein